MVQHSRPQLGEGPVPRRRRVCRPVGAEVGIRSGEGGPLRVGSEIVVRSIDSGGSTIRALRVTARLRLPGSALAAALASPGLSVVYQQVELLTVVRESAASAEQEFDIVWRGGDSLLDQMPDPEPIERAVMG